MLVWCGTSLVFKTRYFLSGFEDSFNQEFPRDMAKVNSFKYICKILSKLAYCEKSSKTVSDVSVRDITFFQNRDKLQGAARKKCKSTACFRILVFNCKVYQK